LGSSLGYRALLWIVLIVIGLYFVVNFA
jgi:hypothetical protein